MKDIIDYLKIKIPSTATRRIDKLVKQGLVKRYNSEEDRRLIKLKLTPDGEELYSMFYHNRLKGLNKMVKEFDQSEIDVFFRVLERFLHLREKFRELHGEGLEFWEEEGE